MGAARHGAFPVHEEHPRGKPIEVFNHGRHRRDFTYIDDIVEGVIRTLDRPAAPNAAFDAMRPDPGTSGAPWRVYNIGNSRPVELLDYIGAIERATAAARR